MRWLWQFKPRSAAGRWVGAALFIAIILLLDASASSAVLHQKICPDAGKPNDQCAVVAFASGALAEPLILAAAIVLLLVAAAPPAWPKEVFPTAPLFRLAPARPPPGPLLRGWNSTSPVWG